MSAVVGLLLVALPLATAAAPAIPQSRTPLTLPFDGDWYVTWGGTTPELNYHGRIWPLHRFAFDFSAVNAAGHTRQGDGRKLTDYFGYGRPILAPAAGTVIFVQDGKPDAPPRTPQPMASVANSVRILHETGEISSMLHLQPGSILVSVGQRVSARQMIGRCGNSGYSTGPHLHYNLQGGRTPDRIAVLASFAWIWVQQDDHWSEAPRHSPVRGQIVRQGDFTRLPVTQPSGTASAGLVVDAAPGRILLHGH